MIKCIGGCRTTASDRGQVFNDKESDGLLVNDLGQKWGAISEGGWGGNILCAILHPKTTKDRCFLEYSCHCRQ